MSVPRAGWMLAAGLAAWVGGAVAARAGEDQPALRLTASQAEFLKLEPILVTLTAEGDDAACLPVALGGESAADRFTFEIEPALKPRKGAKPLPVEAATASSRARTYDLLEWFQFPGDGAFTARAVLEHGGARLVSNPIRITVHAPRKGDAEFDAVARLHHMPWSNYDTNKFCGDTFDVVQKWPGSKLVKYCLYWNGRYCQNTKEYDKAIASYRALLETYPDFALAAAARAGIEECKKAREAK